MIKKNQKIHEFLQKNIYIIYNIHSLIYLYSGVYKNFLINTITTLIIMFIIFLYKHYKLFKFNYKLNYKMYISFALYHELFYILFTSLVIINHIFLC